MKTAFRVLSIVLILIALWGMFMGWYSTKSPYLDDGSMWFNTKEDDSVGSAYEMVYYLDDLDDIFDNIEDYFDASKAEKERLNETYKEYFGVSYLMFCFSTVIGAFATPLTFLLMLIALILHLCGKKTNGWFMFLGVLPLLFAMVVSYIAQDSYMNYLTAQGFVDFAINVSFNLGMFVTPIAALLSVIFWACGYERRAALAGGYTGSFYAAPVTPNYGAAADPTAYTPAAPAYAPAVKHCNACGAPLEEGMRFCNRCGTPVAPAAPEKPRCAACGAELVEGFRFCGVCGAAVTQPEAPKVETAPQPEEAAPAPEAAPTVVLTKEPDPMPEPAPAAPEAQERADSFFKAAPSLDTPEQPAPAAPVIPETSPVVPDVSDAPAAPAAPVCAACGAPLEEGARFCTRCGTAVSAEPTAPAAALCPTCGSVLDPDAHFCNICGTPTGR